MTRKEKDIVWLLGGLYIAFLCFDCTGTSVFVKYASILLCLFLSLSALQTLDGRLTALALLLTAAADWLLLVKNQRYLLGVLLFCMVQLLYALRLFFLRGRIYYPLLWVRLLPLLLFRETVPLLAAAGFYFVNLCCNAIEAWWLRRLFAVGLTLFIACDICVGGWNLGIAAPFTSVGMWLFYLPSQVCIALSSFR